ncbi:dTMP kinase [Actinosynnema sp. NPDC023587]|uniref:dTMP kinase n=1 Tax=Actinosynnema sp. NPDC023587 TaxID=3154695 RepID=UPI0033F0540D
MTAPTPEQRRLPGTLVTVDGPGGVGKSTTVARLVELLTATGTAAHGTTQPSRTPLGELIRHGTDTFHGLALAHLCAGDRHHQLTDEVLPALATGTVVVSDRYVPASLVLQGLDGLSADTVWTINHGVYRPDLTVILNAHPDTIECRLRTRGAHSRFERDPDNAIRESLGYHHTANYLREHGWPVVTIDTTSTHPDRTAAQIADLIRSPHARTTTNTTERTPQENPACP